MFDRTPCTDPLDLAIVGYVRGSVLVQMEREQEALQLAQKTGKSATREGLMP